MPSEPKGTESYEAPEVQLRAVTPDNADKIDVWALGICLHLLVLGFNPFQDQNYRAHVLHQLKQAQSNQQSGVRAACKQHASSARAAPERRQRACTLVAARTTRAVAGRRSRALAHRQTSC